MTFKSGFITFVVLTVALVASPAHSDSVRDASDVTARVLAGLPIFDPALVSRSPVASHAKKIDEKWKLFQKLRLAAVEDWASREIARPTSDATAVFYPFSGPDFLYAHAFFPAARTYVLVGLEPVGVSPELSAMDNTALTIYLGAMTASLSAAIDWGFFRTGSMSTAFSEDNLRGVTPILLFFLARRGAQIEDVRPIALDAEGKESPLPKFDGARGVRIRFRLRGESDPRSLYYFSADLSNSMFKEKSPLWNFVRSQGKTLTFLKSASYLMHKGYYSTIRDLILETSFAILEDDSGIPLRHLKKSGFTVKFFGHYDKPIKLFENWRQDDLVQAFGSGAAPLPFGIGYRYKQSESHLIFAVRP